MFAIGYGIPPNGPLRAIRMNSTPLAAEVAFYLRRIGSSTREPLADVSVGLVASGQKSRGAQ